MVNVFIVTVTAIGCVNLNRVPNSNIITTYKYDDYNKARMAYQEQIEGHEVPFGCSDKDVSFEDKSFDETVKQIKEEPTDDDVKYDKQAELDKDKSSTAISVEDRQEW